MFAQLFLPHGSMKMEESEIPEPVMYFGCKISIII